MWLQKTRWFRTNKNYSRNRHIFSDHISLHCDLEDRIPFFSMAFRLMVVHHSTKFGYKRLRTNTQPSGNKCVSGALHPSPLKTLSFLLSCCLTSTEARWPIRDRDRVGRGRESERLDRGNRPKKTGETVDRRQNNGSVKAVSPRHCPAGGGDSSVVRAPDSWLKGRGFESLLERRENFLLQGRLSVVTLISVSVSPPCYHSST